MKIISPVTTVTRSLAKKAMLAGFVVAASVAAAAASALPADGDGGEGDICITCINYFGKWLCVPICI